MVQAALFSSSRGESHTDALQAWEQAIAAAPQPPQTANIETPFAFRTKAASPPTPDRRTKATPLPQAQPRARPPAELLASESKAAPIVASSSVPSVETLPHMVADWDRHPTGATVAAKCPELKPLPQGSPQAVEPRPLRFDEMAFFISSTVKGKRYFGENFQVRITFVLLAAPFRAPFTLL